MSDSLLTPSLYSKIFVFVDTLPDAEKLTDSEKELIVSFLLTCLSLKKSRSIKSAKWLGAFFCWCKSYIFLKGFIMKNKLLITVIGFGVAMATSASAALTAPTLSTTDFEAVAGAVVLALGVMWAIKKALGLIRA